MTQPLQPLSSPCRPSGPAAPRAPRARSRRQRRPPTNAVGADALQHAHRLQNRPASSTWTGRPMAVGVRIGDPPEAVDDDVAACVVRERAAQWRRNFRRRRQRFRALYVTGLMALYRTPANPVALAYRAQRRAGSYRRLDPDALGVSADRARPAWFRDSAPHSAHIRTLQLLHKAHGGVRPETLSRKPGSRGTLAAFGVPPKPLLRIGQCLARAPPRY